MSLFIFQPRPSNGCRELAKALRARRIRPTPTTQMDRFSTFSNRDMVINWGSSNLWEDALGCGAKILNSPKAIAQTSNKLSFFRLVRGANEAPRIPSFTDNRDEALKWSNNGSTIVARAVLSGHSGAGITICKPGVDIPHNPLYTIYVPKKDEYRVHIVAGDVIDVQRKARRKDFDGEYNSRVRNLAGGYVYVREGINPPPDVIEQARRAFRLSGLDFGAVDVLWNDKQQRAYVLEINTAPGLEGTTVTKYAEAFKKITK